MPTQQSKYEIRLRELGCIPCAEEFSPGVMDKIYNVIEGIVGSSLRTLSRKDRRAYIAQGKLPCFFAPPSLSSPPGKPDHLHITLDTGEMWRGPLGIEPALSEMGFKDFSHRVKFRGPTAH